MARARQAEYRQGRTCRKGRRGGAPASYPARERVADGTVLTVDREGGDGRALRLAAAGEWVAREANRLERLTEEADGQLGGAGLGQDARVELDLTGITRLDTVGARLLGGTRQRLEHQGVTVELRTGDEAQRTLMEEVMTRVAEAPAGPARTNGFVDWLAEVGGVMRGVGSDTVTVVAFLGGLIRTIGRMLMGRERLRLPATVKQIELSSFRGVPIICLISFLVGGIVAQQTIFQLNRFGAAIFVVDLLGILMLREVGLLLSAIMVAGRSGSAITAELGSMRMREEIDALQVMGLDPMEVLVLPRIVGLIIGLPLLSFLASMTGIFGGALVAWTYGGVTPATFLQHLRDAISLSTFLVGIIKAPVMALMIGLIACIEGFKVKGSAESLGRQTTASVVKSIFVVIVVDGIFAVFFASINF